MMLIQESCYDKLNLHKKSRFLPENPVELNQGLEPTLKSTSTINTGCKDSCVEKLILFLILHKFSKLQTIVFHGHSRHILINPLKNKVLNVGEQDHNIQAHEHA